MGAQEEGIGVEEEFVGSEKWKKNGQFLPIQYILLKKEKIRDNKTKLLIRTKWLLIFLKKLMKNIFYFFIRIALN